jgi:hypothetical protein
MARSLVGRHLTNAEWNDLYASIKISEITRVVHENFSYCIAFTEYCAIDKLKLFIDDGLACRRERRQ